MRPGNSLSEGMQPAGERGYDPAILEAELVHLLYSQSAVALVGNLVNGLLVCVVLWEPGHNYSPLAWFGSVVAIAIVRYVFLRLYRRAQPDAQHIARWRTLAFVGAAMAGAGWGVAGSVLLPPESSPAQVLIVFVLAGMTAGGVPYLSPVLGAYVAYAVLALLPLAGTLLLFGDSSHIAMSFMVLIYTLLMLATAARANKTYRESFALRFENRSLVEHLGRANERMQQINAELTAEIGERRRIETALGEQENRALVTLESIGDGVITTDVAGVIEYLNPVAENLTGWSLQQARGRILPEVLNVVDGDTDHPLEDPVVRCLRDGRLVDLPENAVLLNHDGRRFAIEESVAPIRDRAGTTIGAVLAFRDVTQERLLAQQISYQASHDPLTGLANRREFEARLERAIASARSERIAHALCYVDLDQFKVVNDSCGHAAGDELLRQIAACVQGKVRENDCVARIGGDEFGVLLEGCLLEKAGQIAESIRSAIANFRFLWEGRSYEVGASIGVVPVTSMTETLAEVLAAGDNACYVAKSRGRNLVYIPEPDDKVVAQRTRGTQWVARLTRAFEENRLRLYYQPIRALSPAAAAHDMGEVLVRMRDERGEMVLPAAFIPVAERYGMMVNLDRWVVAETFATLASASDAFPHRIVSINISGQSVGDAGFPEFVVEQLGRSGIEPYRICFEVTDAVAAAHLAHMARLVSTLRSVGCRFALDDFGSGVSLFSLKTLKLDYLKIAGSFVQGMQDNHIDRGIIESINDVGHVMGMLTIAKLVENESTLADVQKIGVDMAQGSIIALPVPMVSVAPALAQRG